MHWAGLLWTLIPYWKLRQPINNVTIWICCNLRSYKFRSADKFSVFITLAWPWKPGVFQEIKPVGYTWNQKLALCVMEWNYLQISLANIVIKSANPVNVEHFICPGNRFTTHSKTHNKVWRWSSSKTNQSCLWMVLQRKLAWGVI